ncbi:MAG TPA: hypothetical protein VHR15_18975 [Ktedonobacterales bacterium]|jgi:hypothetical protein|nr:hypothetical protein [Ktedonobacterales bacterium]
MPLQNRVTPFGEIVAVPERGTLMGNRGILHDDAGRLVRSWQVRRWIACRTAFRGRHRQLLQPHSWTELFFLDEATAFAAGHRPCAECRHADYQRFKSAWEVAVGVPNGADAMDVVLHTDRLEGRGVNQRKRTYWERLAALPDGVFIRLDGSAWLLWREQLLEWSAGGYCARRSRPPAASRVEVLTPRSLVAVLRAGYPLQVHISVENAI